MGTKNTARESAEWREMCEATAALVPFCAALVNATTDEARMAALWPLLDAIRPLVQWNDELNHLLRDRPSDASASHGDSASIPF